MAHLDLSDEEREALTRHLREHISESRYPFAPALRLLKSVLATLNPQPEPMVVQSVADRYPVPATKRKRRTSQ
jgi:hypothetical protein